MEGATGLCVFPGVLRVETLVLNGSIILDTVHQNIVNQDELN